MHKSVIESNHSYTHTLQKLNTITDKYAHSLYKEPVLSGFQSYVVSGFVNSISGQFRK